MVPQWRGKKDVINSLNYVVILHNNVNSVKWDDGTLTKTNFGYQYLLCYPLIYECSDVNIT